MLEFPHGLNFQFSERNFRGVKFRKNIYGSIWKARIRRQDQNPKRQIRNQKTSPEKSSNKKRTLV